ncbi:hypothetical protein HGG70_05235 [Rhodobacteraceae bacterium R_SAG4]|nr:hypothetical protein [Rhodobacteraceae bacterium R_SAG4]
MHLQHIHEANIAGLERAERLRLSEIACARRSLTTPKMNWDRARDLAKATNDPEVLVSWTEATFGPKETWARERREVLAMTLWDMGFQDCALEINFPDTY